MVVVIYCNVYRAQLPLNSEYHLTAHKFFSMISLCCGFDICYMNRVRHNLLAFWISEQLSHSLLNNKGALLSGSRWFMVAGHYSHFAGGGSTRTLHFVPVRPNVYIERFLVVEYQLSPVYFIIAG